MSDINYHVFLGRDGNLAVGRRLYLADSESILSGELGYVLAFADKSDHVGWALDFGDNTCPMVNKRVVEERLEDLGEL